MKSSRRSRFVSPTTPTFSTATTKTKTSRTDRNTTPDSQSITTKEIPINSNSINETLIIPIPSKPPPITAIVKIQSTYRSHLIRNMIKKISSVNKEADELETQIQQQETVDKIRSNEKEKLSMNEALMRLLLKLDSVRGVYEPVRELRRRVSRRIVGLQEILDAITDERVRDSDELIRTWEDVVAEMEGRVCEDLAGRRINGDQERFLMEKYCIETLGFRCLERFFRGV
ncbi:BAG family molecular chaperone regulator 5, mitochondrial [Papaver somniferum]|uniref:BAG family molecular chaperone regulator 5, mitochondrial n=1 Tax=Papaver somniferum TaxID=3469 RepID=UPI000E6FB54C|nr:BAG family molecular chaperone regulator 5, mitochondrial [Papaver somniferum]